MVWIQFLTDREAELNKRTGVLSLVALSLLSSASAFSGDVRGMITTRTGETLIVKTGNGNVTVVFTAGTTTKDDRGLFGLELDHLSDVVLRTFLAR